MIGVKEERIFNSPYERGYLRDLVETILTEDRFESRTVAWQDKPETSKKTNAILFAVAPLLVLPSPSITGIFGQLAILFS